MQPAYLLDDTVNITPDFHTTETQRLEQLARNNAQAIQNSERALQYQAKLDKVEVLEAYTLKADGTRIAVSSDAMQRRSLPVSAQGTFSDLRQFVVIFPDVEPGDRTILQARISRDHPALPGGYVDEFDIPAGAGAAEARVTLHLPAGMNLQASAQGFQEVAQGDPTVRVWRYQAARTHGQATLRVSSFADYDALGHALAAGFLRAMTITPAIQALADRITAGTEVPHDQARRIYEWVSRHIRYVDIQIGEGGVVPHAAEEVLRNHYGDCKDHSVLLATLLKAKGIDARVALINMGLKYDLGQPATLFNLDHAIVYIPSLDLYADSTAGVAPFGTVPFLEYGKPVIMMVSDGPVLAHLPILPPNAARWEVESKAVLSATGVISGTTHIRAAGPFATELRLLARGFAAKGSKAAAQQQLRMLGYNGSGEFRIRDDAGQDPQYSISGDFTLQPRPELLTGISFRLPAGLQTVLRPGAFLLGSLPDADPGRTAPVPCWSGEETEVLTLVLPAGKKVRTLPPPLSIESGHVQFTRIWSVEGQTVTLRRRFISHVDDIFCQGSTRAADQAALARIRADYRAGQIALEDSPAPVQRPTESRRAIDERGRRNEGSVSQVAPFGSLRGFGQSLICYLRGRTGPGFFRALRGGQEGGPATYPPADSYW